MERRGSGIAKMLDAYKNDIKKPRFNVSENIFSTIFFSRLYTDDGDKNNPETSQNIRKSTKEIVFDYIRMNGKTARKYIIEELYLTEGQVKHSIKKLLEEEKIESKGNGKNTYYVIKEKNN